MEGKRAVKTLLRGLTIRYFEREKSIHEGLNHPLIVGFDTFLVPTANRRAEIVTEFVPNGSLADHLPSANCSELNQLNRLTGGTRIAIVVAGIVMAMRYLHWRRIVHRDLKPANILLDWDWIVRICDFTHALSVDACGDACSDQAAQLTPSPSMELRYAAPESAHNLPALKSDVFSFGLILFEMLSGQPAFSPQTPDPILLNQLAFTEVRPEIPDFVWPCARELIRDCWAQKPCNRPSFEQILEDLDKTDFQITAGVRCGEVREFVKSVKRREQELGIDIDDAG
jgi:serine/threonine protein kinase